MRLNCRFRQQRAGRSEQLLERLPECNVDIGHGHELAEIDQRGKLSLHAVLTDEQLAAEAEGEAARKASRESGPRRERESRESRDGDGEQPRRERRPRRRRMRTADSSEEE